MIPTQQQEMEKAIKTNPMVGVNALAEAIKSNNKQMFNDLLETLHIDPSEPDDNGITAYMHAAESGGMHSENTTMLEYLVNRRGYPGSAEMQQNLISLAAANRNTKVIAYILRNHNSIAREISSNLILALTSALLANNREAVGVILDNTSKNNINAVINAAIAEVAKERSSHWFKMFLSTSLPWLANLVIPDFMAQQQLIADVRQVMLSTEEKATPISPTTNGQTLENSETESLGTTPQIQTILNLSQPLRTAQHDHEAADTRLSSLPPLPPNPKATPKETKKDNSDGENRASSNLPPPDDETEAESKRLG